MFPELFIFILYLFEALLKAEVIVLMCLHAGLSVATRLLESDLCLYYKVEDISRFLHNTKGQYCVEVEQFFPDLCQFIHNAAFLLKEQAFTFTDKRISANC